MPIENTIRWLKTASVIVMFFALIVALGAHPATSWPLNFSADLIFWPVDGTQVTTAAETRLISGISGGVMFGWGILMWLIADKLFKREPEISRSIILTSIGTWFVIDSTASVIAGAPLNALLNCSFLFLYFVPLMRMTKPATA